MASFPAYVTKPPPFTLNNCPKLPQLIKTSSLFRASPIPSLKKPISSHLDSGSPRFTSKLSKSTYGFGKMNYLHGSNKINEGLIATKSAGTDQGQPAFSFSIVVKILHLVASLGIVLASDKLLKKAFVAASIKFPSALFGMFCVFSVLMILDSVFPAAATSVMNFFEPATLFIQRYLPLFYVPSLVVLPLAVRDVPAASGLKICFIIAGGWLASLAVAGYTALTVRKIVKTEMIPAEPMTKPSPFSVIELWAWTAIFVSSFGLAYFQPVALGTSARTCLPFLLAATVIGYMVGSG